MVEHRQRALLLNQLLNLVSHATSVLYRVIGNISPRRRDVNERKLRLAIPNPESLVVLLFQSEDVLSVRVPRALPWAELF
jgi:hypothetical protein